MAPLSPKATRSGSCRTAGAQLSFAGPAPGRGHGLYILIYVFSLVTAFSLLLFHDLRRVAGADYAVTASFGRALTSRFSRLKDS